MEKLFEYLDDARFVYHWEEYQSIIVWFGGNQLHRISYQGDQLECWTNYELTDSEKSTRQIIKEHIELIEEERRNGEL